MAIIGLGRSAMGQSVRQDLVNLLTATGLWEEEILVWPEADYRDRDFIEPRELAVIMAHLAASLDYSNFKSMIGKTADQRAKLDAYHEVWHRLAALQEQ